MYYLSAYTLDGCVGRDVVVVMIVVEGGGLAGEKNI